MAVTSQELAIVLRARDDASAVLAGAAKSTGTSAESMKTSFSGVGLAARAAAGFIGGTLVGALADAARAAAEDAAITAKLQQAVENSGVSWEANTEIIGARIKAGQALAFGDSQTTASLQALTETTGSLDKALGLQSLAMDLARAKNLDLTKASELVGRVAEGNTTVLSRYGVQLAAGATASEALAELQTKFGGQAEAYGKTTSAAIFRVKDAIGEWQESIGAALGPAQQYIAMLPGMQSGLKLVTGGLGAMLPLIPAIGGAFLSLIPRVLGSAGALLSHAAASWAAIGPALLVVGAIGLVVTAFVEIYKTVQLVADNWGKVMYLIRQATAGMRSAVVSLLDNLGSALGWIGDRAGDLADAFGRAFGWIVDRARDIFNMLPKVIRDRIGDLGDFGRGMIGNFQRGLAERVPGMLRAVGEFADGIGETIGAVVADVREVGGDLVGGLGAGMESMRGWLGGQLAGLGSLIPEQLRLGAGDIEGLGLSIPADLATGIWKGSGAAKSAAEALGQGVTAAVAGSLGTISADLLAILRRMGLVSAGGVPVPGGGAPPSSGGGGVAPPPQPSPGSTGPGGSIWVPGLGWAGGVGGGVPLPTFQHGGVMPWTGLAHLEQGEVVSREPGGITINFNAPIYGMLDFEQQIKRIVRDAFPQRRTA